MSRLVREYFDENIPALEKECAKCKVEEEIADPDGRCARCGKREKIERFGEDFRAWLAFLIDLYNRMRAGWRVRNNELTLEEWRALARIQEHFSMKREAEILAMAKGEGSA